MKRILKLFVFCSLLIVTASSCHSKSENQKAKEVFLKNMTLLKRSANESGFNLKDTPKAIQEMEEWTSIPSKTKALLQLKLKPTQGDLIIWELWYQENQDMLYWDDDGHKIKRMEK